MSDTQTTQNDFRLSEDTIIGIGELAPKLLFRASVTLREYTMAKAEFDWIIQRLVQKSGLQQIDEIAMGNVADPEGMARALNLAASAPEDDFWHQIHSAEIAEGAKNMLGLNHV